MATTPISTLKNWFKKGLKPLETQFAAWLDSYWHKDATDIPIGSISGLNALLSTLVEQSTITALLDGVPTPGNTLNKLYVLIQNIVGLAAPEAFSGAGGAFPTTYGGLAIKAGSPFRITSGGTIGSSNPKNVNAEDLLIALVNNPTNNGNDWQVVESNRELATSSVLGLVKLAQSIVSSGNVDETISTAGLKILLDAINTSVGLKEATANKDVSGGYVGLTLFKINFKNALNTFTSFFTNANTASRTYTFQDRNGTIADDTDLGTKQSTSAKDATGGYVGLTLFKINFKNALNTFTSFFTNANTAARTYTFQDRDGTIADDTDLGTKQNTSGKDATGGYAGLTLFKINFKNAANTFTSFFTNVNTDARTYTFQDRDGTIADNTDLGLKAPIASPTFTGTASTPNILVTGQAAASGKFSLAAIDDTGKILKEAPLDYNPTTGELTVNGLNDLNTTYSFIIKNQSGNVVARFRNDQVMELGGSSFIWKVNSGIASGNARVEFLPNIAQAFIFGNGTDTYLEFESTTASPSLKTKVQRKLDIGISAPWVEDQFNTQVTATNNTKTTVGSIAIPTDESIVVEAKFLCIAPDGTTVSYFIRGTWRNNAGTMTEDSAPNVTEIPSASTTDADIEINNTTKKIDFTFTTEASGAKAYDVNVYVSFMKKIKPS